MGPPTLGMLLQLCPNRQQVEKTVYLCRIALQHISRLCHLSLLQFRCFGSLALTEEVVLVSLLEGFLLLILVASTSKSVLVEHQLKTLLQGNLRLAIQGEFQAIRAEATLPSIDL